MNNKLVYAAWFAIALGGSVWPAMAQESLGEKKIWREQEKYLADEGTDMKSKCGKDLPSSFDKPSYKDQLEANYSVYGYCAELYSALRTICADPDGKEAVQKKVNRLECEARVGTFCHERLIGFEFGKTCQQIFAAGKCAVGIICSTVLIE